MLPKRILKVGDRGLATHVSHVLHSMLTVVQSRSSAFWELSAPQEADVVFVGQTETLSSSSSNQVVIVVSDGQAGQARSVAAFVLHYPFRVMQLLTLLDSIADHLQARITPDPTLPVPAGWVPAVAFRAATRTPPGTDFQVAARTGNGDHLWLDAHGAWMRMVTLLHLRSGPLDVGPFAPAPAPRPMDAVHCPLPDLGWHLGRHGPGSLAPWLATDTAYGLQRWPDLGRLGTPDPWLDLCAHLATQPCTPAQLGARSGQSPDTVHRFLAAASLAGCLTGSTRDVAWSPSAAPVVAVVPGWRRFLVQLRQRFA